MLAVGVLGRTAHADVSSAGWRSQASTAVVVDEAWTRSAGSRRSVGARLMSRRAQRRLVWTRSFGSSLASTEAMASSQGGGGEAGPVGAAAASTGADVQRRTVAEATAAKQAASAKQVLWEQRWRQRELMSGGVR